MFNNSLHFLPLCAHFVQGKIPKEMGLLANLTHLRLSYNSFMSTLPTKLGELSHLTLFHLHSNRVEGIAPDIDNRLMQGKYSFVTGEPRTTALSTNTYIASSHSLTFVCKCI